jgi:FKBP-type peptidyl-prolyl cis-trans isomerase
MPTRLLRPATRVASTLLLLALAACGGDNSPTAVDQDPKTVTYATALGVNLAQMTEKVPGLFVQDLAVGAGLTSSNGRNLTMHYTGWLANGSKFDSSRDANRPFDFTLGAGMVIRGWDIGVEGMRVGGRRRLVIAPALGYGASGSGPIPGGAVLVFDVELLAVR